jgi:CheY-like chemotaxis protein
MELSLENDVDLADLAASAVSTVSGLLKDRPVTLAQEVPAGLPRVRVDPLKIRQVLINLLSNAAKFTETGSIRLAVAEQNGPRGSRELRVSVSDTGPGIAPEDLDKLFLPFSQVEGGFSRKVGGTGLGLSISKRLVEMHGGCIGVDSQVGAGSTFYFSLPLEAAPAPAPASPVALVLDSGQNLAGLYGRYLSGRGDLLESPAGRTARAAVEAARRLQPAFILLDLPPAAAEGLKVLTALQSDPETCRLPVIVCSLQEAHRAEALRLGARAYLLKPVLEADLVRALQALA